MGNKIQIVVDQLNLVHKTMNECANKHILKDAIKQLEQINSSNDIQNVRLSLPDNLEEEILKSKRFRKCDWTNLDGINYLKMMPDTEIAKMVRDIVKKSNEA